MIAMWLLWAACRVEPCGAAEMLDCDGRCVSVAFWGDGICDRGVERGSPRLSCDDLEWDRGDCPQPEVCGSDELVDCVGLCVLADRLGDGTCDDDPAIGDLSCAMMAFDEGDCLVDGCPPGQVRDCADACYSTMRIGNGFCDDGTEYAWGAADFACERFEGDGGDCDAEEVPSACLAGKIDDCAGVCHNPVRVGNGFCDDGTVYPWGSSDFDCAAFGFDGGDCPFPPDTGDTDHTDHPVDTGAGDSGDTDVAGP